MYLGKRVTSTGQFLCCRVPSPRVTAADLGCLKAAVYTLHVYPAPPQVWSVRVLVCDVSRRSGMK